MTRTTPSTVEVETFAIDDIRDLAYSFLNALEAQNKSPKTVKTYGEAVTQLTAFLLEQGMPTEVSKLSRDHVEAFMVSLLRRAKASTANNRYRALQQFFKFLQEEGEIPASPMVNMKPPKVPEEPVEHVELEDLRKILKTCATTAKESRMIATKLENTRDEAIIRFLFDTGVRSAELIALQLDDVDVRGRSATVLGKGRRPRTVEFGAKTALALDRYLRARRAAAFASSPWLWLGVRGPMTDSGLRQMLERRSQAAGVRHVHPHMLRHSQATEHMRNGGSETALMRNMGWRSPQMIRRYTAAAADELAREEHRRMALGDQL